MISACYHHIWDNGRCGNRACGKNERDFLFARKLKGFVGELIGEEIKEKRKKISTVFLGLPFHMRHASARLMRTTTQRTAPCIFCCAVIGYGCWNNNNAHRLFSEYEAKIPRIFRIDV